MEEDCTIATLLVIDDDEEELRGTLRAILEERSYAVHEARHGREGVACGQTHTMALVMTDLVMPKQEGIETMQQLRTLTPPPKIIAISGGGYTGRLHFLSAATVLGADRTLQKPIWARDLRMTVEELLAETSRLSRAPPEPTRGTVRPLSRRRRGSGRTTRNADARWLWYGSAQSATTSAPTPGQSPAS